MAAVDERIEHPASRWGADFEPDRLALLELRMWKAYYRRQPARLFGTLVLALREQATVSWPTAIYAAGLLTKAAVGFARSTADYDRFAPDIARGYRALGLPASVDLDTVAREELRWWVVRREIGLAAGTAAGESIARLYAALYTVPWLQSATPAGCGASQPRFAIAARPPIRTAPRAMARRTGPKWPDCWASPIAA